MRIQLPNGDVLIPDAEFREKAGGITARTGNNWDKQGCPHAYIGGFKYRPEREGLNWLASRIRRRNPRRNPKAAQEFPPEAIAAGRGRPVSNWRRR